MNVDAKITFTSLHNISFSYFVIYQSTAKILVSYNSSSSDENVNIEQMNTLVLIVLKQCSEVYPHC